MTARDEPLLRGTLVALSAAVLFGLTTPVIARFGRGAGPYTVAALLYLGAAVIAMVLGALLPRAGRALSRAALPRVVAVSFFGAALAPSLLAWGIGRAGPTAASLSLNLEAPATVALAALICGEPIGGRVWLAMLAMLAGGTLVGVDVAATPAFDALGVLAVAAAAVAWAADNTLTRGLAEEDPLQIVAAKGGLGAALTMVSALVAHERAPTGVQIAALVACGATGYGLSLALYLLAQRRIGAARTASVFAVGPFIGAAAGWLLGDRAAGMGAAFGALAFMVGVWLHLSERHGHRHRHVAEEHEHAHRHDDGHHDHQHDPPVEGEHTHRHRHGQTEHAHPHAPDVHHVHTH